MRDVAAAVERGDVDELIGVVNGLCLDGDWDGLEELAWRARAAIDRGHQLWPVAAHADYRLALEAPAEWAAAVVEPGRGRFAPGPLTEVVASTHGWAELRDHLPEPALAAVVAQERAIRGEDLSGESGISPQFLELPLRLEPWEPDYPLAAYHPDGAEFPAPALPAIGAVGVVVTEGAGGRPADGQEEVVRALLDLVGGWTADSTGQARAVAVEGSAADAVERLSGPEVERGLAPVDGRQALAAMAWCGASGGAQGRRRGMAAGRFSAWWALAALAGLLDAWPVPPAEMGAALEDLSFHRFEVGGPPTGWRLGLAVEDPEAGLAWAVAARDPAVSEGTGRPEDG